MGRNMKHLYPFLPITAPVAACGSTSAVVSRNLKCNILAFNINELFLRHKEGGMMKSLALVAALCGLAAFSSAAEAKAARCDITSKQNNARYQGPCDFNPSKGGSFELGVPDAAAEKLETMFPIYVEITSPGRGSLQIYKWSEPIRRDPQQPACWANASYRICAY